MDFSDFTSLTELQRAFPDDSTCMGHLERIRWDGYVTSPFDPISKVYKCANGQYRCRNTGKYFNAKTGTIFYNSKIALPKWFAAIWIVAHASGPVTSVQLARDLEFTQKTAWYLLRRIHKYLGLDYQKRDSARKVTQPVEQIEIAAEKDRKQLLEWLQILKK